MKTLYILAALMIIGILLMMVSSYKVFSAIDSTDLQKKNPAALQPQARWYVVMSYLGITLFIVGAVGAIFALFQVMNRRF